MKLQISWTDKLPGGIKRETRVSFPNSFTVKWQFKRSDEDRWSYDTPPSSEDWARLTERMEAFYFRRRAPLKLLELVRNGAGKASHVETLPDL